MKTNLYLLEEAKKYFKDSNSIASKANEVKAKYLKALDEYINNDNFYSAEAKKEKMMTISLDPIEFIQKFGVNGEKERLEKNIAFSADIVQSSPIFDTSVYNPYAFSHCRLVAFLKAKEEWDMLKNDEKIMLKLYEAIKIIDEGLNFKNCFRHVIGDNIKEDDFIFYTFDDALFNFDFYSINAIPEHEKELFDDAMKNYKEKYLNTQTEEKEL